MSPGKRTEGGAQVDLSARGRVTKGRLECLQEREEEVKGIRNRCRRLEKVKMRLEYIKRKREKERERERERERACTHYITNFSQIWFSV